MNDNIIELMKAGLYSAILTVIAMITLLAILGIQMMITVWPIMIIMFIAFVPAILKHIFCWWN